MYQVLNVGIINWWIGQVQHTLVGTLVISEPTNRARRVEYIYIFKCSPFHILGNIGILAQL